MIQASESTLKLYYANESSRAYEPILWNDSVMRFFKQKLF